MFDVGTHDENKTTLGFPTKVPKEMHTFLYMITLFFKLIGCLIVNKNILCFDGLEGQVVN